MQITLFMLAILSVVVALGSSALAQPVPTVALGQLVEGGEVRITGSGFGLKSQAAPIFFDTQDKVWINGTMSQPYAGLADGTLVPVGASWPWQRSRGGDVRIWREGGYPRYRGNFSADPQNATLDYPGGFPDPTLKQVNEVYIRWWWKSSFDPNDNSYSSDGKGTSAKFIRIWDSDGSLEYGLRISWTQMHLVGMSEGFSYWEDWNIPGAGVVGAWNLFEVYLNTTTGTFLAKINNTVIHNVTGYVWPDPKPQGIQPRLWGIDGSGMRDWSGETVEFSDYYADRTRARVEIGNAATWSATTIREPQIPLAWSPNEIRTELYKGRLDSFNGKYLYVVDSEGRVNTQGIPLGNSPNQLLPPSSLMIKATE